MAFEKGPYPPQNVHVLYCLIKIGVLFLTVCLLGSCKWGACSHRCFRFYFIFPLFPLEGDLDPGDLVIQLLGGFHFSLSFVCHHGRFALECVFPQVLSSVCVSTSSVVRVSVSANAVVSAFSYVWLSVVHFCQLCHQCLC